MAEKKSDIGKGTPCLVKKTNTRHGRRDKATLAREWRSAAPKGEKAKKGSQAGSTLRLVGKKLSAQKKGGMEALLAIILWFQLIWPNLG